MTSDCIFGKEVGSCEEMVKETGRQSARKPSPVEWAGWESRALWLLLNRFNFIASITDTLEGFVVGGDQIWVPKVVLFLS